MRASDGEVDDEVTGEESEPHYSGSRTREAAVLRG